MTKASAVVATMVAETAQAHEKTAIENAAAEKMGAAEAAAKPAAKHVSAAQEPHERNAEKTVAAKPTVEVTKALAVVAMVADGSPV